MNITFKQLSIDAGLAACSVPECNAKVLVALNPHTGESIDPNIAINIFADLLLAKCINTIEATAKETMIKSGHDCSTAEHIENIKRTFGIIR